MKGSYSALLAVGAGMAGAVAVWMTEPPPTPVPSSPEVTTVAPARPPAMIPQPEKPSPAPLPPPQPQPDIAAAPPPIYSEPPHAERPAPVLKAKSSPPPPIFKPAPAVTVPAVPPPSPVPYQEPTPRKAADPVTVAAAKAQPEPVPAPSLPPEPAGRQAILERGQDLSVRVLQTLSAENVQVGDVFHGELAEPLIVNGLVIGERGAPVKGRVVEVQRGHFFGGGATITLRLLNFFTADGQHIEISTEPWTVKGVSGQAVIHFRLAARISITERRL